METWKHITGYGENYVINSDGEILNRHGRKMVFKLRNGYPSVGLSIDNNQRIFYVHRLVSSVFIPNPENKQFVNHKNSIISDFRVENLEWCTAKENTQHCIAAGRFTLGFRNGLLKPFAKNIIADFKNGCTIISISKKYGLNYKSVSNLKYRNNYHYLAGL